MFLIIRLNLLVAFKMTDFRFWYLYGIVILANHADITLTNKLIEK